MPVASARFHPAVEEWLAEAFASPTRAQELAWPHIRGQRSTLLSAPTGSGKTLAAFLAAIDRLTFSERPGAAEGCRVAYVSPLRALAVDIERNLRTPLAGIARVAQRRGDAFTLPTVGLRTGDTPAAERARLARHPPDILITTPESLFLVLTSKARQMLRSIEVVIVDEIHALVGNKRGAHLALSLERLEDVAGRPLQRIGLSATQRPLEVVARYLGGGGAVSGEPQRAVRIVDASARKAFDLEVAVPVEDMSRPGEPLDVDGAPEAASLATRRSIWPAIHPRLLELIRAHRSTILFVNSRRLAERLAAALNEAAGEELVRAHHGSVAREQRLLIEDALKAGRLPALAATSSLELGIDMGAVDLVVQIETPPSVASGMQRIGRASHQAGAVSRGVIFPKYRGDLLATAAITRAMQEGEVEETRLPRNPLDVLAQQLAAIVAGGERRVDELFALVRRAAPFAELPRAQFEGVLDMLSGRYPATDFAELRPRLHWDRLRGVVRAREGTARVVVTNPGTIPDRGLYGVFLADGNGGGRRVGELDEEMVFESREGEVFVLGASSWRIVEITRDRVLVEPAPGEPGKMPFWKADRPPRPVALGRAIGSLTRELLAAEEAKALERLRAEHALDDNAADNLLAYLAEQKQITGAVPDDRTLVLERTRDEMGDWRLCLLSPWGGRVHAPWALALQAHLRDEGDTECETIWSDDGIVIRVPDREDPPDAAALLPEPEEIEALVMRELPKTALFAAYFREAAGRALLLPRRKPGQRTPLWMQRRRAADLLRVAAEHPSFPIILETFRECLQDVFDVPSLVELARRVRRRDLRLVTVDTTAPSPFSASLLFGYVANYLYDGDAPLAERRAQALSVDQRQLRELLGEAELRELLDPEALAELELSLQCLDERRKAHDADHLHDLLLRLGDLTAGELAARVQPPEPSGRGRRAKPETVAARWTKDLVDDKRAVALRVGGEERYAAVEDAARFRDALGCALPAGLPRALVEPAPDALDDLVSRYARTHGPFAAAELAERFGLGTGVVESVLVRLRDAGRVLEGEFRPGGRGHEWCDPQVLATLRRRSLSRLRRQVEPAEPATYARFVLGWHGVGEQPAGSAGDALLDVVERLQGAAIPASTLESSVLPSRIAGYRPGDLDALCASGEVAWIGAGRLGERDGRLALYLADDWPLLQQPPADVPTTELHQKLREHLSRRGACFFPDIQAVLGSGPPGALVEALWDLVWSGEVTNDSLAPLRSLLAASSPRSRRISRRLGTYRSRRESPPQVAGRWSLVSREPKPTPTEALAARAEQLLVRHGILTRQAVVAEGVAGGFSALYPVLSAMEDSGRVRRGYFVEGLGGSQFAEAGAVERLRASKEVVDDERGVVLSATDPANPWGALLGWPEGSGFQRLAGAHVLLVGGTLVAWISRSEREVVVRLPEDEPQRSHAGRAAAAALEAWCRRTARPAIGWGEEGPSLARGPFAPFLRDAGFEPSGPGLRLARRSSSAADA